MEPPTFTNAPSRTLIGRTGMDAYVSTSSDLASTNVRGLKALYLVDLVCITIPTNGVGEILEVVNGFRM